MSQVGRGYDINKTFIIEPLFVTGDTPTVTACTAVYTNAISSCSGDTQIFLESGVITFDGNLYTNDDLSASTINASTYLSGGTNIFDIITLKNITGGTFDDTTDTLTLFKQDNTSVSVTGFTDYYTTGATLISNTVYFDRNDELSAYTLSLSAFSTVDIYVTGVTFSDNQLIITRNDNVSVNTFINNFTGLTVNGILSANTVNSDNYFSGGTNLSTIINDVNLTGGTFNSNLGVLSLNKTNGSIQITGFTDFYITGVTYDNNNVLTFTNNNGQSLSVLFNIFSGLTVNGLISSDTISATTYQNLPTSLDVFVTGGTYTNGTAVFTNNTGGTFNVSGFVTGFTDTFVTGSTYNNSNVFTFTNNTGGTFSILINQMSGLTINGSLITDAVSATTYQNLPISGVTNGVGISTSITDGNVTITNTLPDQVVTITGGTNIEIVGSYPNFGVNFTGSTGSDFTGGTVSGATIFTNGLSANTISATTYLGLPIDVFVTGGTYTNGNILFVNNTGGTFNVSGLVTGDTYWVSGSTGLFSLKTNNTSGLDATGNYAMAQGFATLSSGAYSHAEGTETTASGGASHAEGELSIANGFASHAEGLQSMSIGEASHSEGLTTTAIGDASHAGGSGSIASGETSFIHSFNSIVLGNRSVVLGGQNLTGTTDDTVFVPRLNVNLLSGGSAVNSVGIDSNGFLVNDNEFDFSLNFIDAIAYPIILPYNWRVDSVDNLSGITYTITNNASPYILGTNISAFTDTISVSAATTGFINLNCVKLG